MMISWDTLWRAIQAVFWAIGGLWSWYMVNCNNKYFNLRIGDEKNLFSCNLIMWFIIMVVCVVNCVKIFI